MTAPLTGTVFHTRQFMPDASVKSLLGMSPLLSKVDSTSEPPAAQSHPFGVVSHRFEPESARSVLLLTIFKPLSAWLLTRSMV